MLTIILPRNGTKHPLLFQRRGELALPAFLQLDMEKRVVTFGYWERNAEPKDVTLGHHMWWQIDPQTSRLAAGKMAKDLESMLERICVGYSFGWNGRDHVGLLSPDAEAAAAEVTARLGEALELHS